MILQALVRYYEARAKQGKIAKPGWCTAKVSYMLDLAQDGTLLGIVPQKEEKKVGKKVIQKPRLLNVPQMESRSSGICANFLCDNAGYLLGIDAEGSGKRTQDCFAAAKERHLKILEHTEGEMAHAICAFFKTWNPEKASDNPDIKDRWEDLITNGNLVFGMQTRYAHEDEAICAAWQAELAETTNADSGICLVTGKQDRIALLHTGIKDVAGAQPSGAKLVSYNKPAHASYGKTQGANAPIGEYAMFAYTTALNDLLSQRQHVLTLGDTTIVYWAEDGEEVYQDIFSGSFDPVEDNQEVLRGIFTALRENRAVPIEYVEMNPNQRFYILGLSPNAARLSVRFFYQDCFGNILKNLSEHYERLRIVRAPYEKEYLGLGRLLQETVNQNAREKKPQPNMAGALCRAILSGGNYPESLYSNTLSRIRTEQGSVTRGRAAIVKAYLMKNKSLFEKGEKFVELNEECRDVPYVLGRIFAVLEDIQERANPGINATIRDRYFNSACATPAMIFPILIRLKNSHIRKIETEKWRIHYEKLLTELLGGLQSYPKRLNLDEQGQFILGYYHQRQKRYTKKEEQKDA